MSGTARCASSARSAWRPSRQVMNSANITPAMASGTQPPSSILVALPATKARSTSSMSPNSTPMRHQGQFHSDLATSAPNKVVISMVPTTDAP